VTNSAEMWEFRRVVSVILIFLCMSVNSFSLLGHNSLHLSSCTSTSALGARSGSYNEENIGGIQHSHLSCISRLSFLHTATASAIGFVTLSPSPSNAVYENDSLKNNLYYLLRVKEACLQEARLISNGKYKDVQRANVKLAVKFILNNYKLNDRVISAAGSIKDVSKRTKATDVGLTVVESLYTILEYFDAGDLENLKVGEDRMGGKLPLVMKGLDAANQNIDEFLSYFSADEVNIVRGLISEENALNEKEFDADLGVILNPSPKV